MTVSLKKLDPLSFTRSNKQFHETLYRRCDNPHLLAIIDREWSSLAVIRRSTFAFVPQRASEAVGEHARLLERIAAGASPAEIEKLVREHVLATARAFLSRAATDDSHPSGHRAAATGVTGEVDAAMTGRADAPSGALPRAAGRRARAGRA
jgi:DNA-binding GntR family transcriptional regulator